jgi:hypothetical protein
MFVKIKNMDNEQNIEQKKIQEGESRLGSHLYCLGALLLARQVSLLPRLVFLANVIDCNWYILWSPKDLKEVAGQSDIAGGVFLIDRFSPAIDLRRYLWH